MTRFARAKGSKASNEKAPEDSTPWEVMRNQLLQAKQDTEEAKKRQEAEQQRIENYENFLKEHKTQKRKATWCDFPESEQRHATEKHLQNEERSFKKKKNKQNKSNNQPQEVSSKQNQQTPSKKKKKNKQNKEFVEEDVSQSNISVPQEVENFIENKIKKAKKKNKQALGEEVTQTQSLAKDDIKKKKNKIKKKNNHSKSIGDNDESTEIQSNDNPIEDISDNKKTIKNYTEGNKAIINKKNKIKALKKKKDKKLLDGKPMRRKPESDRSFQLIINGKEVELVKFDGFPIMKRDAVRIEELKNSMIKKGIPKSEVQRTIKLERRRAEKALARLKRDVCYNCRKGGHNLSDCPDLKSKIPGVDAAEGVCFKCGSTEHRQFECKVQRDKEFRFATCFICKEPGHIARQCPDNPKGLYPNGGCCKLCGDVTHLRKDCPTVNEKKDDTTVKLQTLATSDNIEDMSVPVKSNASVEPSKKPKKIKF